ncbi:hypothetical protein QJQ45_008687 [Haematococcus lacustris]|nr:hypothetical protein QJQ45_008687 [Haematococcus lacustris]
MASSTHLPGVQGQCCVRHIRTWTSLRVEGASRLSSGFLARSTGNAATTTADLATARAPAAAAAGATPLPPEADPAAAARFLNGRVQQLCLDLGITRHTAWRLASAYPDLTPDQLEHRASHLSSCLSLDAETVCVLAVKERGLVTRAPADLAAALAALGQVMGGMTSMEASKVVVYSPGLLALSAPQLHQQAAALQQALGCEEEPVAALIRQQPYLLTTPTAAVAGRVNQLASTLQLSSREQAVALLTAYPPLVLAMVLLFPPILLTHQDITAAVDTTEAVNSGQLGYPTKATVGEGSEDDNAFHDDDDEEEAGPSKRVSGKRHSPVTTTVETGQKVFGTVWLGTIPRSNSLRNYESGHGSQTQTRLADCAGAVDFPSSERPFEQRNARTLTVMGVPASTTDEELRSIFEAFGDVRGMYTRRKADGVVVVDYYDVRAAASAASTLQGTLMQERPIHLSFTHPAATDGSLEQGIAQGQITVYNMDPGTTNQHLVWLFSKFGEVQGIHQSPNRPTQKCITFYDSRHAAAALKAMNCAEQLSALPSHLTPQQVAKLQSHTSGPNLVQLDQLARAADSRSGLALPTEGGSGWAPRSQEAPAQHWGQHGSGGPSSSGRGAWLGQGLASLGSAGQGSWEEGAATSPATMERLLHLVKQQQQGLGSNSAGSYRGTASSPHPTSPSPSYPDIANMLLPPAAGRQPPPPQPYQHLDTPQGALPSHQASPPPHPHHPSSSMQVSKFLQGSQAYRQGMLDAARGLHMSDSASSMASAPSSFISASCSQGGVLGSSLPSLPPSSSPLAGLFSSGMGRHGSYPSAGHMANHDSRGTGMRGHPPHSLGPSTVGSSSSSHHHHLHHQQQQEEVAAAANAAALYSAAAAAFAEQDAAERSVSQAVDQQLRMMQASEAAASMLLGLGISSGGHSEDLQDSSRSGAGHHAAGHTSWPPGSHPHTLDPVTAYSCQPGQAHHSALDLPGAAWQDAAAAAVTAATSTAASLYGSATDLPSTLKAGSGSGRSSSRDLAGSASQGSPAGFDRGPLPTGAGGGADGLLGLGQYPPLTPQHLAQLQAAQQAQAQHLAMVQLLQAGGSIGSLAAAAGLHAAAAQILQAAGLSHLGSCLAGVGLGGFDASTAQLLQQSAMGLANMSAAGRHGLGLPPGGGPRGGGPGGYGGRGGLMGSGEGSSRSGGRLSRRTTDPAAEAERKLQQERLYALDLDKIARGEDRRTTLMMWVTCCKHPCNGAGMRWSGCKGLASRQVICLVATLLLLLLPLLPPLLPPLLLPLLLCLLLPLLPLLLPLLLLTIDVTVIITVSTDSWSCIAHAYALPVLGLVGRSKNIPNKYTQKMLLATVDEHFKGTYDFLYLPIDFKNKCNVGYAFINLIMPASIIPLVQRFNHKKWERFNSEKVCSISYARIQGRAALVQHFQNSSLMHEDKRCRPVLFTLEECGDMAVAGEQEPFPPSSCPGPQLGLGSSAGGSMGGSHTRLSGLGSSSNSLHQSHHGSSNSLQQLMQQQQPGGVGPQGGGRHVQ